MANKVTAQDVVQALTTLYTHPDPSAKREANAWLVDFQLKPGAWQIAYELLAAQLPEEVQFFGVQTLHTKIQREWETLAVEHKTAISRDLVSRLHTICTDPHASQHGLSTVSSRMCACVAAAGVRMTPALWPTLIADIIAITKQPHPPTTFHVALSILGVLPEELEAGRMAQKRKMEAKKVLQDGTPAVLELVRQVLRPSAPPSPPTRSPTSPGSPLSSPILSATPRTSPYPVSLDPASVPLQAAALRCVRAWVEWGVPVTDLLTDGGTLLGATFDGLASPELLSFSADVLVELFTPPRQLTSGLVVSTSRLCFDQTIYQEVVRAAISRVLACIPLYQQSVIDKRSEVCVALSRVASAIGCGNPSTVISTDEGMELLQFILTCSSHSDKTVVMPTLEFWESTASLVSSNPLNQLNQLNQLNAVPAITKALSHLLPILVQQCKFTRDVVPDNNAPEATRRNHETAESKSQEHEVLDFRLAAIDPFLGIFRALCAQRYLQLLAEALAPPPPSSLTWQTLEAAVYATKVVAEENATELAQGHALRLAVQLTEGVADVLNPGVTQRALPALLASSFAGLVKTLPHEVWQHASLTNKTIAILVGLLSFPPRTGALFLDNVSSALVELTTTTLLAFTAPVFAPHLATLAGACVSNYLPSSVRDLLATTFLSISQISLSAEQSGSVIADMVSSLASRINQHITTTSVSHEAALEVVADVQIIDSLLGSHIPINEQLVINLLQLMESVAQRTYQKEGEAVIDALCRLCTTVLSLPHPTAHARVVSLLVATYVKTGHASPLKALAVALSSPSVKGKAGTPPTPAAVATVNALEQVLAQVANFTLTNLHSLSTPTAGTFFWAMTCAVQVTPPLASLAPAVLHVAKAAAASLPRMLDDPLAATYTIAYLGLVPTHPLFADHVGTIRDELVELTFASLPHIQERGLVRPLGDLLFSLLTHPQQGAAARGAAHAAVHKNAGFARFVEEERVRILRVVLGITAKPRFRAMWTDLFSIVSGEAELDSLLAYELA